MRTGARNSYRDRLRDGQRRSAASWLSSSIAKAQVYRRICLVRIRPVTATDGGALARAIIFGLRGGDPLWRRGVGRWHMYCRVSGQNFTRYGSCTNEFDPKRASSPRTLATPMGAEGPDFSSFWSCGALGLFMPQAPRKVALGFFTANTLKRGQFEVYRLQ